MQACTRLIAAAFAAAVKRTATQIKIRPAAAPQAVAAAPLLHDLCGTWAAASCGELDLGGGAAGGAAGGAPQQLLARGGLCGPLEGWVRRGWVKPPGRAIRKALARRGGDVSLVLDVCRGRIVFETPSQVHCTTTKCGVRFYLVVK